MPAYSLVRAYMLDSKGVGWHQAPRWFHLKCIINCFEEKIWSLNCLCIVVCFYWLPLKSYIILRMRNIILKGFWYPALYSDWYPMLLFESSLSSAFWNVLSYSVIRAYSVSDFEKCSTLFCYFSLLCYLELRSRTLILRKWNSPSPGSSTIKDVSLNKSHLLEFGFMCHTCWAHFTCHYKLWPHQRVIPSLFNNSLSLAKGKTIIRIYYPYFGLVFQNFAFPSCFPYIISVQGSS